MQQGALQILQKNKGTYNKVFENKFLFHQNTSKNLTFGAKASQTQILFYCFKVASERFGVF